MKRLLLIGAFAIAAISPAQEKSMRPPVWMMESLSDIYEAGLLTRTPHAPHPWPSTRSEVAEWVNETCWQLNKLLAQSRRLDEVITEVPGERLEREFYKRIAENIEWASLLAELARELHPEVSPQTVSDLERIMHMAEGQQPFPDVPRSHWAAGAVNRLRNEGLIVGYPAQIFLQSAKKTGQNRLGQGPPVNLPDIPANHDLYIAAAHLKAAGLPSITSYRGPRPNTKNEFVDATIEAFRKVKKLTANFSSMKTFKATYAGNEADLVNALDGLSTWIKRFTPDLKRRKMDVPYMRNSVDKVRKHFANHGLS